MNAGSVSREIKVINATSNGLTIVVCSLYGTSPDCTVDMLIANFLNAIQCLHIFSGCLLPCHQNFMETQSALSAQFIIGFPCRLYADAFVQFISNCPKSN